MDNLRGLLSIRGTQRIIPNAIRGLYRVRNREEGVDDRTDENYFRLRRVTEEWRIIGLLIGYTRMHG